MAGDVVVHEYGDPGKPVLLLLHPDWSPHSWPAVQRWYLWSC